MYIAKRITVGLSLCFHSVVLLLCSFCFSGSYGGSIVLFIPQKDEVYLNLVLDYVPETVYRVARHFSKAKTIIPIIYVKVKLSGWLTLRPLSTS